MKTISLEGGFGCIREASDPPEKVPEIVVDEGQARLLAAVALVEQDKPAAFAAKVAEVKVALASSSAVLAEEKPAEDIEP